MADLTATGAAARSFSAVQAEIEGMILDNGTPVASNVITAVGSQTAGGNLKYSDVIEIPDDVDALGRKPVMAGKMLLVPAISGSGFLQFQDPAGGALITSALGIPNYVAGSVMFRCAVRLPSGKILLVPHANTGLVEYDPWSNTVRSILAHGRTSTGAVPAFSGAAVGYDGLVYFSPGHPTDKAVCTYNETSEAFTVTTMVMPYGSDWQTSDNGGSVIPLPDKSLLFLSRRQAAVGAPWRVNPYAALDADRVKNATGSVAATMLGGQLSRDGKHVVIADLFANKVRFYRLSDNTVFDAIFYGSNISGNPTSAAVPLSDGRIALIGNGYRAMIIVDPIAFSAEIGLGSFAGLTTPVDGSSANTVTARALKSGSVFVLGGTNLNTHFTWQPYTTGTLTDGVRLSRYVDHR